MKKHCITLVLAALLSMPLLLKAQTPVSITFAVNDSSIGAINPPPGTYSFSEGDEFSINATAIDGYRIMGWVITGELDGEPFYTPLDTAVATLTATADLVNGCDSYNVVAIFETADIYPDSLTIVLQVNHPHMGTVDPEPGIYHFALGDMVYFVAEPNDGYEFIGWHSTIVHPSLGVSQYEDLLMPFNTVGPYYVQSEMGYVNRLIALFQPIGGVAVSDVTAPEFYAQGSNGRIVLRGAEGREVYLFDLQGRMLHHTRYAAAAHTFAVPSSGLYLIKVVGLGSKSVLVTP
ncbi:MAG: hypothetical protein K5864_03425 [Bacteroidales bacterium]|nr:hypothetical protein [Bacteroidales bacterium]